ncbi:MAG: hypothetical protein ACRESR_09970 [Gammaproteobacteria bacterium]
MADDAALVAATPSHPSPHRSRVGVPLLLFGVFGGVAFYAAQLYLNYGLASFSCYPRGAPVTRLVPGWGWVWDGMLAISLAAFCVSVGAAYVGFHCWDSTRGEHEGGHMALLERGEGRTRFLGYVGLVFGALYATAIVFDLIALAIVPQCTGIG